MRSQDQCRLLYLLPLVSCMAIGVWHASCTLSTPPPDGIDSVGDGDTGMPDDGVDPDTDGNNGESPDFPPVFSGSPGTAAVFFSDIISGPNQGGEAGEGAYVTLFGNGFGDERAGSTVTVGGAAATNYPIWTQTKIAFRIPPQATNGDILVHTTDGDSNAVPFAIRAGNLRCVSMSGDDSASGAFGDCWATLPYAVDSAQPGDIIYAMDGVSASTEHRYSAGLSIELGGTSQAPIALLAYPGASVTIGAPTGLEFGLRIPNIGASADYWVLGGLRFRGAVNAIELGGAGSTGWRVIGNDISCPNGDGQTGCFAASLSAQVQFLGNEVHDTGIVGASKQYHAVYFTTDSNHINVGWNHIHDNNTCRALQFHSSPLCVPDCGASDTTGYNQFSLIVHDNLIHGDVCDGINLATVDPSRGSVEVFNNIVYDVGRGPDPPDGSSNYACIYVPGGTNTGSDGSGVVEVYNNTLFDCGAIGGSSAGAIARPGNSPNLTIRLRNNIVVQPPGQPFFSPDSDPSLVTGTNNLWMGDDAAPASLDNNIEGDPRFTDATGGDVTLLPGSAAIDAGADLDLAWDVAGRGRPQGAGIDVGAVEAP